MNTTVGMSVENYTSNDTCIQFHDAVQASLIIILGIVIVIVIIGNTLVIVSIVTTRRLRTITNCFVMSLAVADWLVGIFVMPLAVAKLIRGQWEFSRALCDTWVSLDILLCTASILSLCAISVDRYLSVTQPLNYSKKLRSKKLALIMILIVWITSGLITAPPIFKWSDPGEPDSKTCGYNKNTGYVIYSAMGSFFIPMTVMLYVYYRISRVIAQRHDQLSHINTSYTRESTQNGLRFEDSDTEKISTENEERNNSANSSSSVNNYRNHKVSETSRSSSTGLLDINSRYSVQYHRSPLSTKLTNKTDDHVDFATTNYEPVARVSSFRRETKTAKTLSIVMGGFVLCWLPFFISYLLIPFIDENQLILQTFTWLGWINSAINPFIYAFYSPDFRRAFWRLTIEHFSRSTRNRTNFVEHQGEQQLVEIG